MIFTLMSGLIVSVVTLFIIGITWESRDDCSNMSELLSYAQMLLTSASFVVLFFEASNAFDIPLIIMICIFIIAISIYCLYVFVTFNFIANMLSLHLNLDFNRELHEKLLENIVTIFTVHPVSNIVFWIITYAVISKKKSLEVIRETMREETWENNYLFSQKRKNNKLLSRLVVGNTIERNNAEKSIIVEIRKVGSIYHYITDTYIDEYYDTNTGIWYLENLGNPMSKNMHLKKKIN